MRICIHRCFCDLVLKHLKMGQMGQTCAGRQLKETGKDTDSFTRPFVLEKNPIGKEQWRVKAQKTPEE